MEIPADDARTADSGAPPESFQQWANRINRPILASYGQGQWVNLNVAYHSWPQREKKSRSAETDFV